MAKVLVTGGAGYVGAHGCKAFAAAGWDVVAYDNLSRGWRNMVRWGPLIEGDVRDTAALTAALDVNKPDLVAHFAAVAYVGESVSDPGLYYDNNVNGTLSLLTAMRRSGTRALLFSSTCATYGDPIVLPIDEAHPQAPINPYGWSKLIVERMIEHHAAAYGLRATMLRYFNAAGADPAGEIGERHEPETHAVPLVIEAALHGSPFSILGSDFRTPDGTAIRDYIHVADLADAHVLAGQRLMTQDGVSTFNLGTETGTSVRELVGAVERATGRRVPVEERPRREGDPAVLVASARRAREVLGWAPRRSDLPTIIETAAAWHGRGNGA